MSQKVKEAAVYRSRTGARAGRKEKLTEVFWWIAAGLTGLVTGLSSVLGFPSFMCAAAAALAGDKAVGVFIGAVISYVIRGSFVDGAVQLCSILAIAAVHALDPFGERRDEPVYASLMTTSALMLFSVVMTAAVPADFYTASMRMVNSLLCGCIVFVAKAVLLARRRSGVYDLTGINGVFIGIFYIMAASSLSSIKLFAFDLGRIIGAFLLLQAVRKYKSAGGAVIGALTACGVVLCEPALAKNTLLLATAGLICGAFVQFGTLVTVLSFLLSSLISLVAVGVNADTYHMFADLAAGSILFAIVPLSEVKKVSRSISGVMSTPDIVGQTTSSRLALAAQTLGEIRYRLDMVTITMDKKTASKTLALEVRRCVCAECPSYELCFGSTDTAQKAFLQLEYETENGEKVTAAEVGERLRCCTRPGLIAEAFCEFNRRLIEEKSENIRMRELRSLLTEQLSAMEDILSDLSFRSSQVRSIDPGLSARLKDLFAVKGCSGAKACVYVDENLCRRADVFVSSAFKGDMIKLTASVSALLDCDMGLPDTVTEDGVTRISFSELPAFTAEAACFTASAGEEYSGDSFEVFDVNGCEKYILLSDGMGTGKRARLDSVFTVSLARKLICSGLSMTTAHRLINSMLRVKGWEESFATMDLMKLDLCGGSASFLKSGAVQSRLCRDGCVTVIGGQAFPAGILAECTPDVREIKLFDGDMIVMTSDGADDETADMLARIAADEPRLSVEEIVRKMGTLAMSRRDKQHCDDLTVIAVRVVAECENR